MLEKIDAKELIFSGEIEDDRVNTCLTLDDYDWMSYKLTTAFRTEKLGRLAVEFEYFGFTTSSMKVTQTHNDVTKNYEYEYPTSLFQKHITIFMTNHLAAWNDTYAFNGEDEVLAFYNEVIEQGKIKESSI